MIIVTGGAGCIGSAIVWALNKRGIKDIILVDGVDHPEKKKEYCITTLTILSSITSIIIKHLKSEILI